MMWWVHSIALVVRMGAPFAGVWREVSGRFPEEYQLREPNAFSSLVVFLDAND